MDCEHDDQTAFFPRSIRDVDEERRRAYEQFTDPRPWHMTEHLGSDLQQHGLLERDADVVNLIFDVPRCTWDAAHIQPPGIYVAKAPPTVEERLNDQRVEMVRELHRALYGETWARTESPQHVWESLLDEVRRLTPSRPKP